jgi:hypothetical protein
MNEDIRVPRVLLIDQNGEKQGEMPISAALGVCGSLISGTQKTPSFLARFHAVPLVQGYVAASIVRWAARILFRGGTAKTPDPLGVSSASRRCVK